MSIGFPCTHRRAVPARVAMILAMLLAAPLAMATDAATTGAEAQQAYLAGNAAEITRLVRDTAAWDKSVDANELYARAFVQFRALQLALAAKNEALAEKSGTACVTALDAAVKRQPRFAEAFALQSACYGYMANLGGFGAIRNGSRSGKSIESALLLDMKSPRVIMIDGFGLYFRPKFVGGDPAKGCARFREAAAAFDAGAGQNGPAGIAWGHAEAHYWVGRCAQTAGDAAGAKRAFARALELEPRFAAARQRGGN
jgi:tetratricopeptide (TPR) repeat protein